MKAKADLNVEDNYNDTPLRWANSRGNGAGYKAVMRKNGKKVGYSYISDDTAALLNAAEEGL